MESIQQEIDSFIDPRLGAHISYHSITWDANCQASTIPTGGNINFHNLPLSGSEPHRHDFAEIILLLSGRLYHHVNGERQLLEPNSLIFIRPTDQHHFSPYAMEKVEMLFIDFLLEPFLSLSEYLEDDEFLKQFTAPVMPPVFTLEESEAGELCRTLLEINSQRYVGKIKKVKIKVLLADLFSRFFIDELQLLNEKRTPEWLKSLCAAMRKPENFIEGLPRMRKLAPCTQEHLCKAFRKHLNKSPTEYINELRVNYAARLLADSDDKIAAIAYDLKFQSLSRFYHIFHRHFGASPAKYRKRAKLKTQSV